jgi:polyhydroxyalkanoate synthase subunit PhaC
MRDGLHPSDDAAQHSPRPLPLFLAMLRSETAALPPRRAAALKGLEAYQTASRPAPRAAMPEVARVGRASLRDYGGTGAPVVFVPSLINPPFVLDLAPDASLLRWLAARGHRVLLVDWGSPSPADRDAEVAAHVEALLLPMLRQLDAPPVLVGYCLGGTIALATAQLLPAAGLALLATPWRFAGFGDTARDRIGELWASARPACEALGLVPMEVLQAGFWSLDPARTVAKFERFGTLDPAGEEAQAFIALEDWANAGAPLPLAAGRDLFERFVAADDPGAGRWQVGGVAIDPAALPCPTLEIASSDDRIVPLATAARLPGFRETAAGHVGMIVGRRARAEVWEPLAAFLSRTAG